MLEPLVAWAVLTCIVKDYTTELGFVLQVSLLSFRMDRCIFEVDQSDPPVP